MSQAVVLARKDLDAYLNSWMGTLTMIFFYIISGIFFALLVVNYSKLSLEAVRNTYQGLRGLGLTRFVFSSLFLNTSIVLMFLVPLLTMRAFAEERKLQTLELLYTYPLSDFDIVWGKYLAAVSFLILMILPTAGYLVIVLWLGGSFDWGPIAVSYLGFLLLGMAYLSLGIFISSLTDNQVVSAIVSFSSLVVFWILDWVASLADGIWAIFFALLSPLNHYREFTLGILDLSHIVYFVFFQFFFLFLTMRSIETRNWKG